MHVLPRVIIVEALAATHGLACGGEGTRRTESPEEVESGKSGDGAT